MTLTKPRKRAIIRISINYCYVPGKQEPAFVGLADLQNPPHKWHGFRIFAHNPEASGSVAQLPTNPRYYYPNAQKWAFGVKTCANSLPYLIEKRDLFVDYKMVLFLR